MHDVFLRRQQWLMLVGNVLLLFSVACGAPSNPQSATTPVSPPVASTSPSASPSAVPPTPTAVSSLTATPIASAAAPEPPPTVAPTATPPATTTPAPSPTQVARAPFDPALAAELQRILDDTVADGYIPGAVLAVSIPGQAPWIGASGIADRQQGRAMEPATNVRIASISKIFTAVVVLQLAEEGRLDLDAPIATYLPDLVPGGATITVRQLLSHTSGLYDYLEDPNFVTLAYQEPERRWEPRELVVYATQFAPLFQAGAPGAWDYSSTNYVLLGMLVEQVTGNPLAQELRQRIFDPLGLERTFSAPDEPIPSTSARGYGGAVDQTNVAMSFAFATANLVSTAEDVQRFVEALVNGELLQPETLDMMYAFVNGQGQYNMPELEYGLGLMRNRLPVGPDPNGQPRPAAASTVLGHIGGFGGFRSAVWSAPESGITIALGVNQAAMDPNTLATRVFDAILMSQER